MRIGDIDVLMPLAKFSFHRFLQSSSSSLVISEETAMSQHCIASISCLLSSARLLSQQREHAFRVLVRGVYAIQLYAAEYWTEYLLLIVGQNGGLHGGSTLHNLLYQLSTAIENAFHNNGKEEHGDAVSQDLRLSQLKEHQNIYNNVRNAILARSLQNLERSLKSERCQWRFLPIST